MQGTDKQSPICEICGNALSPQRMDGKGAALTRYCSNACRQRAYRRRIKVGTVMASESGATQLSTFVGREHELTELRQILRGTRLLTLTGVPGVGKSRLATELAKKEQRVNHRDTIVVDFCAPDLVSLRPEQIVEVFEEIIDEQIASLSRRSADSSDEQLVLLENCEGVLEICASSVINLLFHFPGVRVVATSREPWRLSGEAVYRLTGLPLPAEADGSSMNACLRADATRLFVDRCRAVNHEFTLTEDNADDMAAICAMLDGLPLALELAAQLARALPVAAIRESLTRGLSELNHGWRNADRRHRSWDSAVRWSYDHLTASEQQLFRCLSAIPGTYGVEAARAAFTDDPDAAVTVSDLLIRLEAKSLIESRAVGSRREPGFGVPAALRPFGHRTLRAAGEESAVLGRLTAWMTEEITRLRGEALPTPATLSWLGEMHCTIHLLVSRPDGADDEVLFLSWALAEAEMASGRDPAEALRMIQHVLRATSPDAARRADALEGALTLACWYGPGDTALELAPEAVRAAARSGGDAPMARAALLSGLAKEMYGDPVDASDDLNTALTLAHRGNDEVMLAVCLSHRARGLLRLGRRDMAAGLIEKALPLLRTSAPPEHLTTALITAGAIALESDDAARAETYFDESLTRDSCRGWFDGMLGLALCAARSNDFERALKLMAAAEGKSFAALRLFPTWRERLVDTRSIATRILPKKRAVTALTSGRNLDSRQSLMLARGQAVPASPAKDDDVLTTREWEVVRLVMEGLANRQIAQRMHLSVRTVETHIRSIRTALGLRSRAHMAAWAARHTENIA